MDKQGMIPIQDLVLRVNKAVVFEPIEDLYVAYDEASNSVHTLNSSGYRIVENVSETFTFQQILELFLAEYEVSEEALKDDLLPLVEQMIQANVLCIVKEPSLSEGA